MMRRMPFVIAGLLVAASPAAAQNVDGPFNERAAAVLARPAPVTSGDIGDRPYRVIGRVETFVGKALWQGTPQQDKLYRELWERARRMGADAVVHATYGNPQHALYSSWGGRQASGEAIHFLTAAELAARAQQPQR